MTEEQQLRERATAALETRDWLAAEAAIGRLWRLRPTSATAPFVIAAGERMAEAIGFRAVKVLILRSFTVEPIIPLLRAASYTHRLDVKVSVGGYNTYAQELLDPNGIAYSSPWDLVILAVETRDIAPDIWEWRDPQSAAQRSEELQEQLRQSIQAFRQNSSAALLVHTLQVPPQCADGVFESQQQNGQARTILSINDSLRKLASEQRDVFVLDYDALTARFGRDRWSDERMRLMTRFPMCMPAAETLAAEWLRFLCPLTGRIAKVLVTDLDQTLWGGVIGEDGVDGIKLDDGFPGAAYMDVQQALADLQRRGIVLAIASKNNPEDAQQAFAKHPNMRLRLEDFAAQRISWQEKAQSLREIAAELNVGIDSVAFLDDNPVEREKVRAALPEVTVLELPEAPLLFAKIVRDCPELQRLRLSEEDTKRTQLYAEQRERTALQQNAGSLEDFFRSLEQKIEIAMVNSASLARVAQLTQKTNQFNATTRRYNEQQVTERMQNDAWDVLSIRAEDRFGDSGLIGVVMVKREGENCVIDTFLLSCRVLGRTIETAILALLAERYRAEGLRTLTGEIVQTPKNGPVRDLYERHGFRGGEARENAARWQMDLSTARLERPEWIQVQNNLQPIHELTR